MSNESGGPDYPGCGCIVCKDDKMNIEQDLKTVRASIFARKGDIQDYTNAVEAIDRISSSLAPVDVTDLIKPSFYPENEPYEAGKNHGWNECVTELNSLGLLRTMEKSDV